jgi:hypothetical protein
MKYSKAIFFVFLFFTITSNYSKNKKEIIPPNGIKINDSTFIDKTEMTNLDYREYLYWLERIFTKDSKKYKDAQPKQKGLWNGFFITDTSNLGLIYQRNSYEQYYFTHPVYNNYPLVGINYEQALKYCEWRTDRIYEVQLSENKIRDLKNQDSIDYFTIDKFLNGQIKFNKVYKSRIAAIPIFRYKLPDSAEYTLALKILDTCKIKYFYSNVNDSVSIEAVSFEYKTLAKNCIYHLYYNVSELVFEKGIIFGGNWKNRTYHSNFTQITNIEPSNYIGFRCVAVKEFPSKDCKVLKE